MFYIDFAHERGRRDGAWHALQGQPPRSAEPETDTRYRSEHHIRHQDFSWFGCRHQAGSDDDGPSYGVLPSGLVVTGVDPTANHEPIFGCGLLQRGRAS